MDLFTYGTLLNKRFFSALTGTKCHRSRGLLEGYVSRRVRDATYPGIMPKLKASVLGMVYHDVPESALQRLDRYEGNMYERKPVIVKLEDGINKKAFAYIIREEFTGHLNGEWEGGP